MSCGDRYLAFYSSGSTAALEDVGVSPRPALLESAEYLLVPR